MTGTLSPGRATSPSGKGLLDTLTLQPPNRTVMDAYKKTSWVQQDPQTKFGSGTRPPLNNPEGGPGPGAYQIKTTMGKVLESHLRTPSQFSIRGRTSFGDPYAKATSKTAANEPG